MLKKRFFGMMTLLVGIMLVFAIAGCNETPTNTTPQTVTFTGTDNSDVYSLEITQNTARAAYTPRAGDSYKLTAGAKTSTGTVVSYTEGTLVLQPGDEEAESFEATVSGTGLTGLTGTITFDDETTVPAPGSLTPSTPPAGGGTVTEADYIGTWENSFTYIGYAMTDRIEIDKYGTFYQIDFHNEYPDTTWTLIGYGKWEFEPASKQLRLGTCVPNIGDDLNNIDYNNTPSMWKQYKIENGKLKPASGSGSEYTKK